MTVTYYLKNCFWGLFGPGFLAYNILNDLQDGLIFPAYIPYMPYVAIYLAIGAVIYPFSFFVLEQLAMKIMKKKRGDIILLLMARHGDFLFFHICFVRCYQYHCSCFIQL